VLALTVGEGVGEVLALTDGEGVGVAGIAVED